MFASLLLAAAEAEAPLIDIDGTVLIQFAIFVIMALVLHTFLFRPYLKVRDDREKGIGGARNEAKMFEERAAASAAEMEGKIAEAKQRGERERQRLRSEAAAYGREVLGAARDTAQKSVQEARASVKAQEESARAQLLAQAESIARQTAQHILGRAL